MIKTLILFLGEALFTAGIGYVLHDIGTHAAFLILWGYLCGVVAQLVNTSDTIARW